MSSNRLLFGDSDHLWDRLLGLDASPERRTGRGHPFRGEHSDSTRATRPVMPQMCNNHIRNVKKGNPDPHFHEPEKESRGELRRAVRCGAGLRYRERRLVSLQAGQWPRLLRGPMMAPAEGSGRHGLKWLHVLSKEHGNLLRASLSWLLRACRPQWAFKNGAMTLVARVGCRASL